ncbi:MAG: hypothetical protein IBX72_12455 [Nitrospirae bacterium]|nr:hypothetical protein [Nitrospirota bacterium]
MPLLPEKTDAQMTAAPYAYPKRFRFTGLIELTYRDYSIESSYYGYKSKSGWTSFEQRYKLGLKGYIYHPKLVTFSTSVTFRKEKADEISGNEWSTKDINYDLLASFLPTRPVSLDLFALKTDSTIEGWGAAPYDIASNFYGARLRYASRKYPSVRLEYNHWDYTIEREKGFIVSDNDHDHFFFFGKRELIIEKKIVKEKTSIDRFSANINGLVKAINTRYNITGDLSDYVSPLRSYKGKNLTTNTYTTIKKENMLSTSFQYSDIDIIKLKRFATNLRLSPIGRLHHSYEYEYFTSETEREKTDSHTISNYLRYRFSRMIFGTAQLRYRFGKRDGVREDSYYVNTGLNYGRSIRDFDLTSYYKFSLSKDERRGEYKYMENSLGIGLSTRKFRLGRIYSNYDISFRKFDFSYKALEASDMISEEISFIEHRIRAGINGKGPGRAYWNIEAEGRIFDSEMKDHRTGFWLGEQHWAEKIRHYTLTGDIGYPVGQRGLAILKASYTTGKTNSENVERYYYEGRINYRLLKNLNVLAWWREEFRNKGWWAGLPTVERGRREFGWKIREYQIELYYLLHRIKISMEYNAYRSEEGPFSTEYKRLFVKLSRPF